MRVVLAVADTSLGGTSRSALLFAGMWKQAGADVLMYSPEPLHQRRVEIAELQHVRVSTSLADVEAYDAALVHLHHAAPSRKTLTWVEAFVSALRDDAVVLTHNVFGQPLPVDLGRKPVVGVLGDWVSTQYRLQSWPSRVPVRIMPNPQDFRFFRPPTDGERDQARAELGISPDDRVVLRVGSPTEEKWSRHGYWSLADAIRAQPTAVVRLIGAPSSFDFEGPRVTIEHEPLADDALRREYWAADVFAHWAGRGESFGNVILEALGTGLPVVYRAVLTRDNTPAEFRDLGDFHYVTSKAAWEQRVLRGPRRGAPSEGANLTRYSAETVLERLRQIVAAGRATPDPMQLRASVVQALPRSGPVRLHDLVAASIRHNPVTALLKRQRLSGAR